MGVSGFAIAVDSPERARLARVRPVIDVERGIFFERCPTGPGESGIAPEVVEARAKMAIAARYSYGRVAVLRTVRWAPRVKDDDVVDVVDAGTALDLIDPLHVVRA